MIFFIKKNRSINQTFNKSKSMKLFIKHKFINNRKLKKRKIKNKTTYRYITN